MTSSSVIHQVDPPWQVGSLLHTTHGSVHFLHARYTHPALNGHHLYPRRMLYQGQSLRSLDGAHCSHLMCYHDYSWQTEPKWPLPCTHATHNNRIGTVPLEQGRVSDTQISWSLAVLKCHRAGMTGWWLFSGSAWFLPSGDQGLPSGRCLTLPPLPQSGEHALLGPVQISQSASCQWNTGV